MYIRFLNCVSLLIICLLTACGKGSDDNADSNESLSDGKDTQAPVVLSTSPINSASDFQLNGSIVITFNESIDPNSLNESTFIVKDSNSNKITGEITSNGAIVTFTPNDVFSSATTYHVTLSSDILDLTGNPLVDEFQWSFTTNSTVLESREWTDTFFIAEATINNGRKYFPDIKMDHHGNAIVLWSQQVGMTHHILARRFDVKTGWAASENIEKNKDGISIFPQLAFDSNGNAYAVWQQWDGTRPILWLNRFDIDSGWEEAKEFVFSQDGNVSSPQLVISSNGDVIVVWGQTTDITSSIWANRYRIESGWETPTKLELGSATNILQLTRLAIDENDNLLTIWLGTDGFVFNVWSNYYSAKSGWNVATKIADGNTGQIATPSIAMDQNGNALAVWAQPGSQVMDIWARRFIAGTGWDTAQKIETNDTGSAFFPQAALSQDGNGIVVWEQEKNNNEVSGFDIWVNRFDITKGWLGANLIDEEEGNAELPKVSIDVNSNILTVWSQYDGIKNSAYAKQYTANAGWSAATKIENDDEADVMLVNIATSPTGAAFAMWWQSPGIGEKIDIYANRFE